MILLLKTLLIKTYKYINSKQKFTIYIYDKRNYFRISME